MSPAQAPEVPLETNRHNYTPYFLDFQVLFSPMIYFVCFLTNKSPSFPSGLPDLAKSLHLARSAGDTPDLKGLLQVPEVHKLPSPVPAPGCRNKRAAFFFCFYYKYDICHPADDTVTRRKVPGKRRASRTLF